RRQIQYPEASGADGHVPSVLGLLVLQHEVALRRIAPATDRIGRSRALQFAVLCEEISIVSMEDYSSRRFQQTSRATHDGIRALPSAVQRERLEDSVHSSSAS